jgi:hypothetical protein
MVGFLKNGSGNDGRKLPPIGAVEFDLGGNSDDIVLRDHNAQLRRMKYQTLGTRSFVLRAAIDAGGEVLLPAWTSAAQAQC